MCGDPIGVATPRNNRVRYLIPTVGQSLFLIVFLFLSFQSRTILLNDADTGYHIRAGEYILKTFYVPSHDIFSFLSPPPKWTAHEWLSEVVMALLHRAFGLTGVVLFFIFLISVTYPLLFRMLRTYRGNFIADLLIISIVIVSSALHWLARPHIFSLVIMVGWYRIVEIFQNDSRNYLYLLPPLMLLWVNLHGGFIAGFLLLAIYFFCNGIKFGFSAGEEKEHAEGKARVLGYTILACLLVSLINPYGYHILAFPFRFVSNRVLMDNVDEFLSPNFHQVMPFKYLLFLMIIILAVSRKKLDIIQISLLLIFLNMALYSVRYIPLFCIVAAPILARQAGYVLSQKEGSRFPTFRSESGNIAAIDSWAKGYPWVVVALLLVTGLAAAGKLAFHFDRKIKPVAAVEFLKEENIKGNMFNNDEFGDYLIYAAYPQYRVFIDGRSDMYGAEKIKEYLNVTSLGSGWEKVLEKYDIGWIFFDANSALSRSLVEKNGWRLIYADPVADIFVKEREEYRDLIKKFGNVTPVTSDEKEAGTR
jgi:hypothetical protein